MTRSLRKLLAALALAASATPALAQEAFHLDVVFVSRFLATPASLGPESDVLRGRLEQELGSAFLVVPLDAVRPYEDYSAAIYLENCKPAQYTECSYVIAARAKANWAISARYTAEQPADPLADREVEVSIIDMATTRAAVTFTAAISAGGEDAFVQGVAAVLQKVINGDHDLTDVRLRPPDARQARDQKRKEDAVVARDIVADNDIDGVMRGVNDDEKLKKQKLTETDLTHYDDRDDAAPWERLKMSREEYLRFQNSGVTLERWRELSKGRTRQLLLRAELGGGAGPYLHSFDGRWALDPTNLQVAEVSVFQEVKSGGTGQGQFEVGFGLSPTLEISANMSIRTGSYAYYFHQEVVGTPEPEGQRFQQPWWTSSLGLRAYISPKPQASLRPSYHAGVAWWSGASPNQVLGDVGMPVYVSALGPFDKPKAMLLEGGGGVELKAGKNVDLFARSTLQLRVAGGEVLATHDGADQLIYDFYEPDPSGPFGLEIAAGVLVRAAPFGKPKIARERDELMDDDPDF